MKQTKKRRAGLLAAAVFWLAVWQAAAMAIGQEVFLVSPIQAAGTLMELLPQADFWQRVGFSAGHILLGFALGVVVSVLLAAAAERWAWVDTLLARSSSWSRPRRWPALSFWRWCGSAGGRSPSSSAF